MNFRNREPMANYLFRETARVHFQYGAGAKAPDRLETYEVILVEGKRAFSS
jgi:hypothetical protein